MNVKELSHYLGYSEDHIYKLKEDAFCEGIHFYKRGKLFFDRIEIDKWVINGSNNDQKTLVKKRMNEILDSVIGKNKAIIFISREEKRLFRSFFNLRNQIPHL